MPDLTPELLVFGFLWYIAFLFSTTCHEAAHALAAKLGGDETAALGGQVTLNPLPHIRRELFGMVLVPILSYLFSGSMIGWASAPFDPNWQRRHPHRAAWMALAGPGANFSLMLLSGICLRLGVAHHWFHGAVSSGGPGLPGTILGIFFSLNLLLGTFNLLPFPPLDGSSALMLLLPESKALRYLDWLRENNFAMLGLVVAFFFFGRVYDYIYAFALYVLYYGLH
ncbi:MAG: site-2 protease family protein [Acidobacteriia bacterium]|nr:site-2 protease family protein [Terriglobia bacterium]